MPTVEGLKRRANEWKPKVVSAFVVYVTPRPSPVEDPDTSFDIVEITDPDDPLLERICFTKYQLRHARRAIGEGRWDVIVALKDGEPVGRIWETFGTEKPLANGVPRVKLADDEFFMFDLFVEREYRRSGVAFTMADHFFRKYPPGETTYNYGYGFISYDNVPSIMWHHSVGFHRPVHQVEDPVQRHASVRPDVAQGPPHGPVEGRVRPAAVPVGAAAAEG